MTGETLVILILGVLAVAGWTSSFMFIRAAMYWHGLYSETVEMIQQVNELAASKESAQ